MKAWHIEMLVVWIILTAVNYFSHTLLTIEILSAFAVLMSFGHAQIADRMAEQESFRVKPSVFCYKQIWFYFVAKESFWLLYFFFHHSYSALTGVFLFLAYPVWRKFYRKYIKHGQNTSH